MRREFMKAYAWALKAQKACLFEPVTVEVNLQYCEENNREFGDISAWTIYLYVWNEKKNKWIDAMWCEWEPERFDNQKIEIINYLKEKGIEL